MGKVWRARHTALKRDDALKVLPDAFAADADRLARFQREAQVLASLNHPNIAHVYGLEEGPAAGPASASATATADKEAGHHVRALVMELVEGPTLAERIEQGPLAVDEALAVARQVLEALEAAHEQGVIHRDLKPANIKLRPDGVVKVLDFGLAKALEPAALSPDFSMSPTITTPAMTQRGVILGTAAYMSPEQARGKAADRRSDIWSFGCVLYEMLTGTRPFAGEDISDTLANVLKVEADWSALPAEVPPRVRVALRACLHKDRKQRIGDVQSVRLALEGAFDSGASQTTQAAEVGHDSVWRRAAPPALAALATALLGGFAAWDFWPTAEPRAVSRFDHVVPEGQQFRGVLRNVIALSPDGRQFAYNTTGGLYLRRFGELEARVIPGTEAGLNSPFFSPDGQTIGYFQEGSLKRIAVSGGTPVVIAPAENPFGVSWASDNAVFFGQSKGVMRVSANGGTPDLVVQAREGEQLAEPQLLPDGDSVLFTATTETGEGRWDRAQVVVQSLRTGERAVIWEGGSDARYVPTGHLIYAVGDALFAVAFDIDRLQVSGGPVSLVRGLTRVANQAGPTATANYAVSADGTLVYLEGRNLGTQGAGLSTLVWVTREGREEAVAAPPRAYFYARISPDGTRVALDVRDQQLDLWVWDLTRAMLTRLTFDPGEDEFPAWSPDGKRIAFSSSRGGGSAAITNLFWVAADGTGAVEQLAKGETRQLFPAFFSPDASRLVVVGAAQADTENDDIGIVSVAAGLSGGNAPTEIRPLLNTRFGELNPSLSPDGRWIAYDSNESGQSEIYVRPFPEVDGGRWQVSTGGGVQPVWARSGRELFYRDGNAIVAVPVQAGPSFAAGNPKTLFEGRYVLGGGGHRSYDVASDGQRFLMIKAAPAAGSEDAQPARFIIVENWFEELRRLVPTN
jgi:Tol biopolymer transport system component